MRSNLIDSIIRQTWRDPDYRHVDEQGFLDESIENAEERDAVVRAVMEDRSNSIAVMDITSIRGALPAGEFLVDVRPPFPETLFWFATNVNPADGESQLFPGEWAVLVFENVEGAGDDLFVAVWAKFVDGSGRPLNGLYALGRGYKDEGQWYFNPAGMGFVSASEKKQGRDGHMHTVSHVFQEVQTALQLLSCKNVTVERVLPSRQERRRIQRFNEQPVNDYRIVVKVPGKTSYTLAGPRRAGEPVIPAHMVRGHFSEYSEERPLFGKYSGRYWIPAHVRGKRDEGQDVKPRDYVVIPAEADAA